LGGIRRTNFTTLIDIVPTILEEPAIRRRIRINGHQAGPMDGEA